MADHQDVDEPNFEERVSEAKKRARRIANGEFQDIEDVNFALRFRIGRAYNIPIFHEYFESRTIDELVFECELISVSAETTEEKTSAVIAENKEELAKDLFSDWDTVATPATPPPQAPPVDDAAVEFMKTGKFLGEDEQQGENK